MAHLDRRKEDAPTAARLRGDIDGGGMGDEAGFPDPSPAPLGADAVARGHAATREGLTIARRQDAGRDERERGCHAEARRVSARRDRG